MSIASKTAVARLLRGVLYAVIAFLIQWALANLGILHVPTAYIPFVSAGLMALDKWVRETVKPDDPDIGNDASPPPVPATTGVPVKSATQARGPDGRFTGKFISSN